MHNHITASGSLLGSVTCVVGLPRIFGLHGDEASVVKITRAAIASKAIDNPQLMNGGANTCLTGIISLLVDVVSVPSLPILVGTTSGALYLDNCCTKRGLLPFTLQDRSINYQPCYYCKNATKTIISPEAILASSNILVRWQQEGHKDARLGTIWFFSDVASTTSPLSWRNKMASTIAPRTSLTSTLTPTNAVDPKSSALTYLILLLFPPDRAAIKLFHQTNLQNPNFGCSGLVPPERRN
jgi:hypothetical protein